MPVRVYTATIRGITPYSQSRAHTAPKANDKESHDEYDQRTWREKAHYDPVTKKVFIPGMGVKQAIDTGAKRLSIPIKGKGKATYTKNIASGVMVIHNIELPITKDETREEVIYANADGIRGSGKRVHRRYPVVPEGWEGKLQVTVIDDEIPNEVTERCIAEAGNLIGIGRFRAEKGGYMGRFLVTKGSWSVQG